MSFIWPSMLVLLIFVPAFVWLYIRRQQKRLAVQRQFAVHFGSFGSGPGKSSAAVNNPGMQRHIPPAFFLAGLTILIVALARPQAVVSLPRVEGTVILAFDVSGSMAADDFTPSRMEAAKAAARDFVQRQPNTVQIGVVAFSDNGFSIQSPTSEQDQVLAAINRLAPQRGTSLANGILASLQTIAASQNPSRIQGDTSGEPSHLTNLTPQPTLTPTPMPKGTYTSAVIVLLTDGENNKSPDPLAAAQSAAHRGVRVYTVGVGSPGGAPLHVDGFTIVTKLNEAMLKQISEITGGTYYNAATEKDLQAIYDHLDPQLAIKAQKMEVTSLFAGASILVFLCGGLLSLLWFSRLP